MLTRRQRAGTTPLRHSIVTIRKLTHQIRTGRYCHQARNSLQVSNRSYAPACPIVAHIVSFRSVAFLQPIALHIFTFFSIHSLCNYQVHSSIAIAFALIGTRASGIAQHRQPHVVPVVGADPAVVGPGGVTGRASGAGFTGGHRRRTVVRHRRVGIRASASSYVQPASASARHAGTGRADASTAATGAAPGNAHSARQA